MRCGSDGSVSTGQPFWGSGLSPGKNLMQSFSDVYVPNSVTALILDWRKARWTTPMGRFHQSILKSTSSWRQRLGTDYVSTSEASCIFPLPLPYPEVASRDLCDEGKPFELRKRRKSASAKQFTNVLVTVANFFELDCPRGGPQIDFHHGELSAAQKAAVQRFHQDAETFCAHPGGVIASTGRGRGRLNSMILSMGSRYNQAGRTMQACKAVTVAEEIIPDRISLPAVAGHFLGSDVMCAGRAKVFEDLSVLRLDDDPIPAKLVRPCHRIDRDEELRFIKTLIEKDVVALVDEAEVARHPLTGELLRGGFFAAPHKEGKLRLIYDRRPANSLERDLSPEWLQLPHGTQFCELMLKRNTGIRGSTDDLQC